MRMGGYRPQPLYVGQRAPVSTVQESWWAPEPLGTDTKKKISYTWRILNPAESRNTDEAMPASRQLNVRHGMNEDPPLVLSWRKQD